MRYRHDVLSCSKAGVRLRLVVCGKLSERLSFSPRAGLFLFRKQQTAPLPQLLVSGALQAGGWKGRYLRSVLLMLSDQKHPFLLPGASPIVSPR